MEKLYFKLCAKGNFIKNHENLFVKNVENFLRCGYSKKKRPTIYLFNMQYYAVMHVNFFTVIVFYNFN